MKKGATHVGFILSFVLFIFSVVFIYTLVQPDLVQNQNKKILLENTETKLENTFSSNITSITTNVNQSSFTQSCFEFSGFISKTKINSNIIVQGPDGSLLTAYISPDGNSLYIERTDENFFKIFNSEEFSSVNTYSGSPSPCKTFTENKQNGYKIGFINTNKEIFESKIKQGITNYNSDYDSMKNNLDIPAENDFSFKFVYDNSSEIGINATTNTINVFAGSDSIIYIDSEANKKPGVLKVSVW